MVRLEIARIFVHYGLIVAGVIGTMYVTIALPVIATRGDTTTINYLVDVLVNADLHVAIAWGTAMAMGSLAWKERHQRLRERKAKDERIKTLERNRDPNRESSGMNVTGTKAIASVNTQG